MSQKVVMDSMNTEILFSVRLHPIGYTKPWVYHCMLWGEHGPVLPGRAITHGRVRIALDVVEKDVRLHKGEIIPGTIQPDIAEWEDLKSGHDLDIAIQKRIGEREAIRNKAALADWWRAKNAHDIHH
jgi:hypothetical protein